MPSNTVHRWVGVFPETGAVIVFDPALQIEGQAGIWVYSVHRDLARKFEPSEIRTKVRAIHGPECSEALEKYDAWKLSDGKDFLRRLRASTEIERNQIIERHKAFLENTGYEYTGTTLGKPKAHRITHCWNCKEHLDNKINVECLACRWIVCSCGACGCGRDS